jgi:hypothetical protein
MSCRHSNFAPPNQIYDASLTNTNAGIKVLNNIVLAVASFQCPLRLEIVALYKKKCEHFKIQWKWYITVAYT